MYLLEIGRWNMSWPIQSIRNSPISHFWINLWQVRFFSAGWKIHVPWILGKPSLSRQKRRRMMASFKITNLYLCVSVNKAPLIRYFIFFRDISSIVCILDSLKRHNFSFLCFLQKDFLPSVIYGNKEVLFLPFM